jgi:N-acetylmuramoyl-L-alanine amidase
VKIVVDQGHGGSDSGAVGPSGLKESYLALEAGKKMKWVLERFGHEVFLTRTADVFMSLESRVDYANELGASLFCSVHFNASDAAAEGIETWYPNNADNQVRSFEAGAALSYIVHQNIMRLVATVDRGCKFKSVEREEFFVIRKTLMPACLLELGFITNPATEKLLQEKYYTDRLALGAAIGLNEFCKL